MSDYEHRQDGPLFRLGRHHGDTVYVQDDAEPHDDDLRMAIFVHENRYRNLRFAHLFVAAFNHKLLCGCFALCRACGGPSGTNAGCDECEYFDRGHAGMSS